MGIENESSNGSNERRTEQIIDKARAELQAALLLFEGRVDSELLNKAREALEIAIRQYEADSKKPGAGYADKIFQRKIEDIIEALVRAYKRPKKLPHD